MSSVTGIVNIDSAKLNVRIAREEVESALAHAPRHKAIGVDSLDSSYLNYEVLIVFLVSFGNHCFLSANVLLHGKSYNFPYP